MIRKNLKGRYLMIPKIIHYCWFGGNPKSGLILRCIESWKKFLPDYEIREWNEETFDVHCNTYVEQAYEAKKWAFVSDYARLYALYNYGGIYLDTDILILKSLDDFLVDKAFMGFESNDSVATGVMGCNPKSVFIKEFLEMYSELKFVKDDGSYDMTTNTSRISKELRQKGLVPNGNTQVVGELKIYKPIIFYPNTVGTIFYRYPKKSFTVHLDDQSWKNQEEKRDMNSIRGRIRKYLVGRLRNFLGTDNVVKIRRQ